MVLNKIKASAQEEEEDTTLTLCISMKLHLKCFEAFEAVTSKHWNHPNETSQNMQDYRIMIEEKWLFGCVLLSPSIKIESQIKHKLQIWTFSMFLTGFIETSLNIETVQICSLCFILDLIWIEISQDPPKQSLLFNHNAIILHILGGLILSGSNVLRLPYRRTIIMDMVVKNVQHGS